MRQLLSHPTIASKNWVYRQYDHTVRTGTVVTPGSDAAVFRIREANKILAATTDCNSLYCRLDPREGARIAVAEAARNLTCSGATPLAVTDNLNFGNPGKPENFWQLKEAVEGLSEACRAFGTPVTGGNVSLYNESPLGVVDPTPTVAMVGLIDDERHITDQFFKNAGDDIILIGKIGDEMGASHFVKVCHGRKEGRPPRLDIDHEIAVQNVTRELIRTGVVKSAHDCSEGGLAVALAECCFNPQQLLGADIDLREAEGKAESSPASNSTAITLLFNETQSRIVISSDPGNRERILSLLQSRNIPNLLLGRVGTTNLRIKLSDSELSCSITELYDDWFNSIRRAVETDSEPIRSL